MWRPSCVGTRALDGWQTVESVVVPLNPEERAMVEFRAWSDSVTFLRVGDAPLLDQPVSVVLMSLTRLGPIKRSSLWLFGVHEASRTCLMIGRSMEVCVRHQCVCAPRGTRSAGVPQVAECAAVVFFLLRRRVSDVNLTKNEHSNGMFFNLCAANSCLYATNSFVHITQREQLHCEHCARKLNRTSQKTKQSMWSAMQFCTFRR